MAVAVALVTTAFLGGAATSAEGAGRLVHPARSRGIVPLMGRDGRPVAIGRTTRRAVPRPAAAGDGVAPTSSRAPKAVAGFDGVGNLNPILSPSDSIGALGTSVYLAAVNVRTAVFDRSGNQLTPAIRLRSIGDQGGPSVLPAHVFDFDPKVVYDQYTDTFVLAFLAVDGGRRFTKSWITIVSVPGATAADPSTWCATRMAGDQFRRDGRQWADYPAVGYTSDRVTVETNQFGFSRGFFGTQILSFRNADLTDCDGALHPKVFGGRATRNPDGTKSFTVQPAQTVGGSSPAVQYMLEFEYRRQSGRKLVLFRLRRTGKGLALSAVDKRVPKDRFPPPGTQLGSSLRDQDEWWDPGDLRLVNAEYDADRNAVYAAHAVQHNIAPSSYVESSIRWFEVTPVGKLKRSDVTRTGIIGTSDRDLGWPAVATDSAGNVFVTYSRAGLKGGGGEYLSAYVSDVPPGSRAPSGSPLLLRAGEATYNYGPGEERWGDFNGINRDPIDAARVATFNQYAKSDGGATTELWQQWVELVIDT